MTGDLHVHTRRSDGPYSPEEAVALAKARGLEFIGIVDHDTTEGLEGAIALGSRLGVVVVPGVEISAYDFKRGRKADILGYKFASPASNIKKLCDPILAARHGMALRQVEALADTCYPIAIAEVPYADAFEALRAIQDDGGIAVLAHPGQCDSWDLAEELLAAGLDGIELYHGSHSHEDQKRVLALARDWPGLILTGGSDDHGSPGSKNSMGEVLAPYGALEALGDFPEPPFRFVRRLVREAGARLREAAAEALAFAVDEGGRRDMVARLDSLVRSFLVAGISARLPRHAFLYDEGGVPHAECPTWVIDPVAGDELAISLSLFDRGLRRFGLVYDVMADEMRSPSPGDHRCAESPFGRGALSRVTHAQVVEC